MKTKAIIKFEARNEKIWVKNLGERIGTHFIFLAEMADGEVLYAATIDSSISKRYKENRFEEIENIELLKEKGKDEHFLQILFTNGEKMTVQDEDYFLLFHLSNGSEKAEDYLLIFNKPSMIREGGHYHFFQSDKAGNAISLFWMLKDFIPKGRSD